MHFHLILTTECNMHCRYCHGKAVEDVEDFEGSFWIDYDVPESMTCSLEELKAFCSKDPGVSLSFYGGEPTLRLDLIRQVMDFIPAKFLMQTNGLLLHKLEPGYLNRFDTLLISVDGNEETNDRNRGPGTYRMVMDRLHLLKDIGFPGELIARMTVNEDTDIFHSVTHLLEAGFPSVHWQLDANFWVGDLKRRPFEDWVEKSYNPGITKLIGFWVRRMEEGKVIKLYPLLGILEALLKEEPALLMCGSGHSNYTIQTDGKIIPCPIMIGMEDFCVGDIRDSHPLKLKKVLVGNPCPGCEIYSKCGGRCLYSNLTKPWGQDGMAKVCATVRHLVKELEKALPRIKKLIGEGKISLEDLEYQKYNGCEIMP